MSLFDTVLVVDWSAAKRAPAKPSKDAIWLAYVTGGTPADPLYFRDRPAAEAWLADFFASEKAAGRRVLASFDFPFGYPTGFARTVTGSDDPFDLWDWFEAHLEDQSDGTNNRYGLAEELNRLTPGPGPFWGKPRKDGHPGLPYKKEGISYDSFCERRACDLVARAASSCFQMNFPPTVGGQIMTGLPMLNRLRRAEGVAVWPFEEWRDGQVVLAEIWPGLIEEAVKAEGGDEIRDRAQVRLLAKALAALSDVDLARMLDAPEAAAGEEGWILGAADRALLTDLAAPPVAPPLRNDCFAMPPGVDWAPVEEALALLRARLHPITCIEEVPLNKARGRIAAVEMTARRANPPLPNTAVDGYGFAGGRGEGLHRLPLVKGRAAAGDAPGAVPEGQAIRVLTGAALPEGVDTVVLQEEVVLRGGAIHFNGPLKQGANTRKAGEDRQAGDPVLAEGRWIGPADLALLSATGAAAVQVRKRLRVGVLSTGSELVEAGAEARADQIYDANRPLLLGLVESFGHHAIDLGKVVDDRALLRQAFDQAAGQVDLILTSGGASTGDEDHVSALLTEAGAMSLWRIAVKPGRPLALGLWEGVPVFGLPGNPVAAMVCTLIFARPAMGLLAGAGWETPQGFDLPAAFAKSKKAGRREYLRARVREGRVEVFASEGSGRVSGLAWAEGLVELSEPAQEIRQGDPVRYIPFGNFGL